MELLSTFPGESRVWIYQADRLLNATEVTWIEEELDKFIPEWANHGKKLTATATVLNDCHLIFVVNQEMLGASGCSIDSSVRFVKAIGNELGVNFFDRFKVLMEGESGKEFVHFSEREKQKGKKYFDTLVDNLNDLKTNFVKVVS